MPFLYLLLILLLLLLVFGPQQWARHVLQKHSVVRPDLAGTGGELVEHLRRRFQLRELKLGSTARGDHYDPLSKTVRLSEENLRNKSLTAVTVAAHEFGHALQHAKGYKPLLARTRLAAMGQYSERLGSILLYALPLLAFMPGGARSLPLLILLLILCMGFSCLIHLVTLPVEFDASFGRALPILKAGNYLEPKDLQAARQILLACALTYLAGSLAGMFNFWRWFRFLGR